MSDPLSTAASIIALFGAFAAIGDRAAGLVRSLKHAPSEISDLLNEVNDVTVVLNQLRANILSTAVAGDLPGSLPEARILSNRAIELHLDHVRSRVAELNHFVDSLRKTCTQSGHSRVDVDRIGWARKKRKALEIRKKLKNAKERLYTFLEANTV